MVLCAILLEMNLPWILLLVVLTDKRNQDMCILKYTKKWRVMKVAWERQGWGEEGYDHQKWKLHQIGRSGKASRRRWHLKHLALQTWLPRQRAWTSSLSSESDSGRVRPGKGRAPFWNPLQWCLAVRWWVFFHQESQPNKIYEVFYPQYQAGSDEVSFLKELTVATISPRQSPKLLGLSCTSNGTTSTATQARPVESL